MAEGGVIFGKSTEKWKTIQFPKKYKSTQVYQISNYGRVRNYKGNDVYRIKKPLFYKNQLLYRFTLPGKVNNGQNICLHLLAKNLVGTHFHDDYEKGKYIVWRDYNRLNNYYKNIIVVDPSEGRSHIAKGRSRKVEQVLVVPPKEKPKRKKESSPHKLEVQDDYFKVIPNFTAYEVNRYGVIRRRKPPYKGRIMKQRVHPDKFYFLDLTNDLKKRKTVYTHKAVAEVWNINVKPGEKNIVIHKDGDTLNNCSDNLEWVTHSEALKYQFAHKQRDNRKSWKTRKKRYGKSGVKKARIKKLA